MLKFLISTIVVSGMLLASCAVAGLVMYLPFDDGKGKVAKDITGNGNDGTINGDAQWVDGKFGGALEFTNRNSWVEPTLEKKWWNENLKSFSVVMWVKSNDMNQPIFFGSQDPGDARLYLAVKDGFWNMGIQDKSWGGGHQGVLAKADKEWHAIALTMDNDTATLYINGEKTITKKYSKYTMNRKPLIGALNKHDGIGYHLTGIMDEVGVWDRVLTQADVKANMERGFAVSPEGRLATVWGDIKK